MFEASILHPVHAAPDRKRSPPPGLLFGGSLNLRLVDADFRWGYFRVNYGNPMNIPYFYNTTECFTLTLKSQGYLQKT
jgi:hypothetical protein